MAILKKAAKDEVQQCVAPLYDFGDIHRGLISYCATETLQSNMTMEAWRVAMQEMMRRIGQRKDAELQVVGDPNLVLFAGEQEHAKVR